MKEHRYRAGDEYRYVVLLTLRQFDKELISTMLIGFVGHSSVGISSQKNRAGYPDRTKTNSTCIPTRSMAAPRFTVRFGCHSGYRTCSRYPHAQTPCILQAVKRTLALNPSLARAAVDLKISAAVWLIPDASQGVARFCRHPCVTTCANRKCSALLGLLIKFLPISVCWNALQAEQRPLVGR
ncbi:hypothetical protein HAV15_004469 [Penicillium sp. str. |nr:hypothetical protein HAV15_004469 [Penicillium sp. str. \